MLLTHSVAAAICSAMVRTAAAGSASSAAGPATFFSRSSSGARLRRWTASDDATVPSRPGPQDPAVPRAGKSGMAATRHSRPHGAASACPLPAPFPPSADRREDSDPRPPAAATRFHRGWWNSWRAPPLRTCKRHVGNAGRRAFSLIRIRVTRTTGRPIRRQNNTHRRRPFQTTEEKAQASLRPVGAAQRPGNRGHRQGCPARVRGQVGGVLFRPHRASGAGQSLHPETQPGGDPAIREREAVEWRARKMLVGSRRQVRSSVPPRRLRQFRRREPLVSKP